VSAAESSVKLSNMKRDKVVTHLQMSGFDVQEFLDSVKEGQAIVVRFFKQNGDIAQYEGTLDVGANRATSVAIYTAEGWKRFSVERVIEIREVE